MGARYKEVTIFSCYSRFRVSNIKNAPLQSRAFFYFKTSSPTAIKLDFFLKSDLDLGLKSVLNYRIDF